MTRVLLIDDDAHFRALARVALDEVGVQVVEAGKGREGAELLREDPAIQAIVVDGLLPDTNGLKWIEAVRASGVELPILFISAFFRDIASFRRLTQLGVQEVMHKPLDMERFAHAVRGLTPRRRKTSVKIDLAAIEKEIGRSLGDKTAGFEFDPTASGSYGDFTLPEHSPLMGPSVLVLSDDAALVEYVCTALRSRVADVAGATQIDDIAPELVPDILFLALPFGRPGESSLVLDLLDGRGQRPRIATLAEDNNITRQLAEDIGADLFLSHPVEGEELPAALSHLEAMTTGGMPRLLIWPKTHSIRCADALDGHEIHLRRVRTFEHFCRTLKTWNPHAVVIDSDDAHLVRTIRISAGGVTPALIVVGPAAEAEALIAGATNVVPTEQATVELIMALARRSQVQLHAADDPLTLMPRRSKALRTLLARSAEARRTRQPLSFAFIAIDGADSLPERVGQEAATDAKRAFASLMRARFRLEDIRVRWTADVFAVAFPRTAGAEIEPAFYRLQDDCKAMRFEGESGPFRLNFCAGIATLGIDGDAFWDVAEVAESRLRMAQSLGRGRITGLSGAD